MTAERPRFGSLIAFSIGSLEITALVLAVAGAAVALLTVNKAGIGSGLVVLWVPILEAALPPTIHRFAPGSAHVVRVLACVMMLSWIGLNMGGASEVVYLFIPAAVVMVVVAAWSGRQRREALRQAIIAAQRRQRKGGQKTRKKRSTS